MAEALSIADDFTVGMVVDLVLEGRPSRRVTITAVDGNTVTAVQYPDEDLVRSRFARGGVIVGPQCDSIRGVGESERSRSVWLDDPIVQTREMIGHSCGECT